MEKHWEYKNYVIREDLKPGSKHFQYFFIVTEAGKKKSNYCVWIEDEALSRFDTTKNFETIAEAKRDDWNKWVKEKIDAGEFKGKVLKYEKTGHKEIDLSEMSEHLSM